MGFQQRRTLRISAVSLAIRHSAEVPTVMGVWNNECPDIEEEAHSARADPDLHSWPPAGHTPELGIRTGPLDHSHHEVQASQAEHQVADEAAVLQFSYSHCPLKLSVLFNAGSSGHGITVNHAITPQEDKRLYLAIVGRQNIKDRVKANNPKHSCLQRVLVL